MKNGFKYDVDAIRAQFPACKLEIAGAPIAYLDGPGGTQVPQPVLDAMVGYMVNDNANEDGNFRASTMARYTEETARRRGGLPGLRGPGGGLQHGLHPE